MIPLAATLAKHARQVYTGGNWTDVNLRDLLADLDHRAAQARIGEHHPIHALTYHIHYYARAITGVLRGGPLEASDAVAFDAPPLPSELAWRARVEQTLAEVEALAQLIEALPDARLSEPFAGEKYGTVYDNLQGFIEHAHYHLGQIALVRKLLRGGAAVPASAPAPTP